VSAIGPAGYAEGFLSSEEESVCFTALTDKAMKFLRDVW
jgi:hypothetical protein